MKKSWITLAVILGVAGNAFAQIANLDDLNYWGAGPNRAALVMYWNDTKSPDALAWGYQWSGTQTVADMFLFMAANDPKLFARIDSAVGFGVGIFGIGYQTGAAAFGVTGAEDVAGNPVTPVFSSGVDDMNTNPASTQAPASSTGVAPLNTADRYKEGWNDTGFWEMYNSGSDNSAIQSSFALPATWTSSFIGAGTELVDGGWAAFSITDTSFNSNPPTANVFAAIPEPTSWVLVGLGLWVLLLRRKKIVCGP